MIEIERVGGLLNRWFIRTAGGADRPALLDIDTVYPALRRVDRAFPEIRREALTLLARRDDLPTVEETYYSGDCLATATPNQWKMFYLVGVGQKAGPNCALCPATTAAVESVPGLFQAQFSILEPGKSVAAHRGPYAGYLRYHLGLVVPTANPPRFRVKDSMYTWREGESVLFDDSHEHEVYNTSTEPRVVLIVDVPRPMPVPQRLVNWVARRVGRRMYGRTIIRNALESSRI